MTIIFNLIIIGLIALIAYWWANEGLFSALLHLVCVIIAGAIALSVWEPLSMAMLSGGGFDNYTWGVVLLGVFAFTLLILRVASDKIVPSNISFPLIVNYTVGSAAGACAGILTVGITLIGAGFLQSTNELMTYRGYGRDESLRASIGPVGDPIWFNAPKFTSDFYEILSIGTLHPDISGTPLQQYNPKLYELSTLVRDSFEEGKGQLSLAPDGAIVATMAKDSRGLVVVKVTFNSIAKDFGSQLILSSSQIRLICESDESEPPKIYYPTAWKQEVKDKGEQLFKFDDISHYATSVPGRQENGIKFAFETKDANVKPKFIQIRGTRFTLPSETTTLSAAAASHYRGVKLSADDILAQIDPLGKNIQHLIDVTAKIRRLRISANNIPGTIELDDDYYFIEGTLTTPWSKQGVSAALAIKGIRPDNGTVIVHLDVSPGKNAEFQNLLSVVPPTSEVILVDSDGRKYSPIGYYIDEGKKMRLSLTPSTPLRTIEELPMHRLTSSKSKGMTLIFQVTQGVLITEFRVGDITVGTCEIEAKSGRRG